MAVCEDCRQKMTEHGSCVWDTVTIKWRAYSRLRYGQETRYGSGLPGYRKDDHGPSCPDCAVSVGGPHHAGCDWEQCPHCGGQEIGCDCGIKQYSRVWA